MALTSRAGALQDMAKGLGVINPMISKAAGNTTAAAAGSGYVLLQMYPNSINTTLPTTLQSFIIPASLPATLLGLMSHLTISVALQRTVAIGYLYTIGTVNLAATGNQFTHDAATFPLLRTQFGLASQAITLTPMIYVTTATTVTAPVFRLRNATGPAVGYVNQDGTSVLGTIDFTFPAAATAQLSMYLCKLEVGDSGVQDITKIDVTTAGSAGAATLFGFEPIIRFPSVLGQPPSLEAMLGQFQMLPMAPAVATSGTVTATLAIVVWGASQGLTLFGPIAGVLNS